MSIDILKEGLQTLLTVVILPAIPILVKYAIDAFNKWLESKTVEIENKTATKYLDEITDIVYQAVMCTTQTYVDSLKSSGNFDSEDQKEAFNRTKTTVLSLLTVEAKSFILEAYGDLDLWLDTKIEQMVAVQK